MGNVGEDHNRHFLVGQIRCLRISRDERYSADFEPESLFAPDANDAPHRAVLLFDGSKVEGKRVSDLSGEGNDGTWVREPQKLRVIAPLFRCWIIWWVF